MFVCWSVKGGSGTTVVAASLALVASRTRPTLLLDLAGDVPAALGLPEPDGPGLGDWLRSPGADAAALARLGLPATDTLRVVVRGQQPPGDAGRWAELATAVDGEPAVVVDAGSRVPPAELCRAGDESLLVTRSCYLSLRRAVATGTRPTGVVLLLEPGRALGVADVEHALGAPVVAVLPYDPAVARAVDAGLLRSRLPRSVGHPLRAIASA